MFRYKTLMTDKLIIALAQVNPTLGAIGENLARAREVLWEAPEADLILFPELFICGYPPEDLVLRPSFVDACREAVESLARDTAGGPAILIGLPWRENGKLHNSVALLANGRIETLRHKFDLPNYGVFDEKRVFDPGPAPGPIAFKGCGLAFRSARISGRRKPARPCRRPGRKSFSCQMAHPSNATRMTCA